MQWRQKCSFFYDVECRAERVARTPFLALQRADDNVDKPYDDGASDAVNEHGAGDRKELGGGAEDEALCLCQVKDKNYFCPGITVIF